MKGRIFKALSGFYYIKSEGRIIECRARGRFRKENISPLVGDKVEYTSDNSGKGIITNIYPRTSEFIRPSVANIDVLVMVASAALPITDPFLIDRVSVISHAAGTDFILCINKCDLNPAELLYSIYLHAGIKVICTSTVSGQGLGKLIQALEGKTCAFTGNSGVGKSSLINALAPHFNIEVGNISEKLGRGRHTTRHIELFELQNNIVIADTPGFSSFELDEMESVPKEKLQECFPEFKPYLGQCRFVNCSHTKERDCAVIEALQNAHIEESRYNSYVRLYQQAKDINCWEDKNYIKYSNQSKKTK